MTSNCGNWISWFPPALATGGSLATENGNKYGTCFKIHCDFFITLLMQSKPIFALAI